jgi:hypothetical protein
VQRSSTEARAGRKFGTVGKRETLNSARLWSTNGRDDSERRANGDCAADGRSAPISRFEYFWQAAAHENFWKAAAHEYFWHAAAQEIAVTDGVGGKDGCASHSNRVEEVGSDVLLAMFPAFISPAGAKHRVKVGARASRQR